MQGAISTVALKKKCPATGDQSLAKQAIVGESEARCLPNMQDFEN